MGLHFRSQGLHSRFQGLHCRSQGLCKAQYEMWILCVGWLCLGQTMSSVAEEKKLNVRLTKSEAEFVEIMNNLNLPYPKFIGRWWFLTPSTSAVPNCCSSKHSAPYWSNPPFLMCWNSDALALRIERQSVQMSAVKNSVLDQYGKV